MIVDTSAMVAVILGEPDAGAIDRALTAFGPRSMSAVTRVELTSVIERRHGSAGRRMVDEFLEACEIPVVPVTETQVTFAIDAFRPATRVQLKRSPVVGLGCSAGIHVLGSVALPPVWSGLSLSQFKPGAGARQVSAASSRRSVPCQIDIGT